MKPLKIAQEKEGEYLKWEGNIPVIFISFKDIKEDTYDGIIEALKSVISKAFKEHDYLYRYKMKKSIESYNMWNDNKVENIDSLTISELESVVLERNI